MDKDAGVLRFLQQNHSGKKIVHDGTLTLGGLKEGWIRVYRPQPLGK